MVIGQLCQLAAAQAASSGCDPLPRVRLWPNKLKDRWKAVEKQRAKEREREREREGEREREAETETEDGDREVSLAASDCSPLPPLLSLRAIVVGDAAASCAPSGSSSSSAPAAPSTACFWRGMPEHSLRAPSGIATFRRTLESTTRMNRLCKAKLARLVADKVN